MNIRLTALWKVPVFCTIASVVSFYLTIYLGGYFFAVQTVGADGVISISADPLRSTLFHGVLFFITLLLGGLWVFRSMTKKEIALSAAILSGIYLVIVLAQLSFPSFPISLSATLAPFQNWTGFLSSMLLKLTGQFSLSVILACFAPFLFVPFGKP